MPIQVSWGDDAQSILHVRYENAWTWKEFEKAQATIRDMVGEREDRIDVIADHSGSPVLPPGALSVGHKIRTRIPMNVSLIMIAGTIPRLRAIYAVFTRLYNRETERFVLVDDPEQAYAYIAEHRSTH